MSWEEAAYIVRKVKEGSGSSGDENNPRFKISNMNLSSSITGFGATVTVRGSYEFSIPLMKTDSAMLYSGRYVSIKAKHGDGRETIIINHTQEKDKEIDLKQYLDDDAVYLYIYSSGSASGSSGTIAVSAIIDELKIW